MRGKSPNWLLGGLIPTTYILGGSLIGCFIALFVSCIEIMITIILFPTQFWHCIGIGGVVIAVIAFFVIDESNTKKHMDKYVDWHKRKLEVLENVLANEFSIKTREKVEELISIYQEYIDKEKGKEKKRKSVIVAIFSALAGVLTISFENMGVIGVDFIGWVYMATALFLLAAVAGLCIYSNSFLDPLKGKYEMMIRDLKGLLLIKY